MQLGLSLSNFLVLMRLSSVLGGVRGGFKGCSEERERERAPAYRIEALFGQTGEKARRTLLMFRRMTSFIAVGACRQVRESSLPVERRAQKTPTGGGHGRWQALIVHLL